MSKLYQIYEHDLAILESELPRLLERPNCDDVIVRKRWEAIKKIICDIRWDYGPPLESFIIEE